jgi:antitoxin component YwqK of YwqJK toxin-antitoxin module
LYYCNGNVQRISYYKKGRLTKSKFYYDNGVLDQCQKKTRKNPNHIKGLLIVNYKNGLPSIRGNYKNNLKKGLWKYYYENGNLKSKGKYIPKEKRIPDKTLDEILKEKYVPNLEPVYDSLKGYEYDVPFKNSLPLVIYHKTGKWSYWDEAGNLVRVQLWKKGELLEDKKYNQKGILIKEEFWEKSILKETKEYDEKGNLIKN